MLILACPNPTPKAFLFVEPLRVCPNKLIMASVHNPVVVYGHLSLFIAVKGSRNAAGHEVCFLLVLRVWRSTIFEHWLVRTDMCLPFSPPCLPFSPAVDWTRLELRFSHASLRI
jgi:hypothetical protein